MNKWILGNTSKSFFTYVHIFESSNLLRAQPYLFRPKYAHFASNIQKLSRFPSSTIQPHIHGIDIQKFIFSSSFFSSKFHTSAVSKYSNKEEISKNGYENTENERTSPGKPTEEKISLVRKFKIMFKQYWYVLLPVHCVTSVIWAGALFFAAKSGVDIVPLLESFGTSEKILGYLRSTDAGYYGITYALYKLATPARYTVTLGGTTFTINYLKKKGYIENVPIREDLKLIYEDKREEFKGKTDEMKEKYQEKRSELLEKYQDKTDEFREKYNEKKEEFIQKYKFSKNNSENEKR